MNPLYATITGEKLMDMKLLMLFRHHAELSSFNILAMYLQDNYGIRAGYSQLAIDLTIPVASLFTSNSTRSRCRSQVPPC